MTTNFIPTTLPTKIQNDPELQPFFFQLTQAMYLFWDKFKAINITSLEGIPEGELVGSVGDMALRTDGGTSTTLYIKESGSNTNTGWIAK